ncbi:hypothetical protein HMPREF1556_00022 [Porphyromonas sp. oral taxon 278 str. W7784]|nr:hypothetical protein HMPREF1556_00022 [Porphyromonas sp. oral taxon 278 str. W7784]
MGGSETSVYAGCSGAYRLWCVAQEGARSVGGYLPLLLLRKDLGEKGRIISKVFEDTY